ncbi:MAG: diacylglycerol/lipid kinase family protein [Bacteroidales bacterium]
MRALVIINPIAGRTRRSLDTEGRVELARRVLGGLGVDAEVATTERAGHAEELARRAAADRCDVVFAWGGDGTVNEVARAVAFTTTALAIIPAGSGNGLARALGVPRDPAVAMSRAVGLAGRRIDGGSINGRFFANVCGVGLDAEVAWRFNQRQSRRRGPLPYVGLAIRAGLRYRALDYRLTLDGATEAARALIIAIANSPEYGNGAIVAPGAVADDGLLDVVVVEDRALVGRLLGARRLLAGSIIGAPGVRRRRARRIVIEADAPTLRFHVDGDPAEAEPALVVVVHPAALLIRA